MALRQRFEVRSPKKQWINFGVGKFPKAPPFASSLNDEFLAIVIESHSGFLTFQCSNVSIHPLVDTTTPSSAE